MEEPTSDGTRAGSRFGHCLLRRLLGKGGFGEVYEVHDTVMDRAVALKLPVGSTTQAVLPFTGLHEPAGIAVDKGGSVYVADKGNTRWSNYWPGQPAPRHVVDVDAHQAQPMSLIERCARRRALSNSLETDHI